MRDAFERLGMERRAALDGEVLKAAYVRESRSAHPDQAGGDAESSADVNAAYELLKEPESRLKHLLELEGAEAGVAWGTVPMEESLMSVFLRLGPVLQRVEAFSKKQEAAASALARALMAGEQMALQEVLEALMGELEALRAELEGALPEVDQLRAAGAADAVERMRTLRAKFAYVRKWQGQSREALMKLV
jgi:curved DNA-binding protein CbpA